MNKNALIVISLGAVAFLLALFFIYFKQTSNNENIEPLNEETQTQTDAMVNEINQTTETTLKSGINENEIIYKVSSGEVTYGADKQFLGKDAENIIGRTSEVEGTGYWNKDNNEIEISASVNLTNLTTDNPNRDGEVQALFTDKIATFRIEPTPIDIQMGEEFEKEMTGQMLINGVSKSVTFNTKGVVTEQNFSVEGATTLKMSDFGITAPNVAGIFSVADELPVNFKISGESISINN